MYIFIIFNLSNQGISFFFDWKRISDVTHKNIFQKAIRKGLHGLDPDYISVLAELRFVHKIALGNCAAVFACVCNGWFNQKYKLGNYTLGIWI